MSSGLLKPGVTLLVSIACRQAAQWGLLLPDIPDTPSVPIPLKRIAVNSSLVEPVHTVTVE